MSLITEKLELYYANKSNFIDSCEHKINDIINI